eukprot:TRINITY_DN38257_c0_g1_i1.p1 TRINITY_DN38257_c0_g1~~TRINITY_DN38257_c0_g1_i1.p1  ORF type:complete len:801 (+),score=174.52 TRINITY_DN38257_c0_g1_i1:62-2464(+)
MPKHAADVDVTVLDVSEAAQQGPQGKHAPRKERRTALKARPSAPKRTGGFLQPSLLRSLERPSDARRLPSWASRLRQRLSAIEVQLRRLQKEKQVLLGKLRSASADVVEDVLEVLRPSSERPAADEAAAAGGKKQQDSFQPALWAAAQGGPLPTFSSSSIHPALCLPDPELVADSAEDDRAEAAKASPHEAEPDTQDNIMLARLWHGHHSKSIGVKDVPSPAREQSSTIAVAGPSSQGTSVAQPAQDKAAAPECMAEAPQDTAAQLKEEVPLNKVPHEARSPSIASTVLVSSDEEAAAAAQLSPKTRRRSSTRPVDQVDTPRHAAKFGKSLRRMHSCGQESPLGEVSWPADANLLILETRSQVEAMVLCNNHEHEDEATAMKSEVQHELKRTPPHTPRRVADGFASPGSTSTVAYGSPSRQNDHKSSRDSDAMPLSELLERMKRDDGQQRGSVVAVGNQVHAVAENPAAGPAQSNDCTGSAADSVDSDLLPLQAPAHSSATDALDTASVAAGSKSSLEARPMQCAEKDVQEALVPFEDEPEIPQQHAASGSRTSQEAPLRLTAENLTDGQLRYWATFFGIKPTFGREFLVKRLREIDAYLNGDTKSRKEDGDSATGSAAAPAAHSSSSAPAQAAAGKRAAKQQTGQLRKKPNRPAAGQPPPPLGSTSPNYVVACSAADMSQRPDRCASSPPSASQRRALKAATSSPSASRAEKAAAKARQVEQMIADAIRADDELYDRLLLFEPVEISELRERIIAKQPSLQGVGEQRLRTFLDAQGLLFASSWRQQASPKAATKRKPRR